MAVDDPLDEVAEVDDVVGALSSPDSQDVYFATLPYNPKVVSAVAARMALEGGGAGGFSGWTQDGTPAAVNSEGGTLTFSDDDPAEYRVTYDFSATDEWVGAMLVKVQDVADLADSSWVLRVVNEADATATFQLDAFGAAAIQESAEGGSDSAAWYWRAADATVVLAVQTGEKKLVTEVELEMGGQKITELGTPTEDTDAVTKGYADLLEGAMPAWWTVVSTAGSESVEFAGGVAVDQSGGADVEIGDPATLLVKAPPDPDQNVKEILDVQDSTGDSRMLIDTSGSVVVEIGPGAGGAAFAVNLDNATPVFRVTGVSGDAAGKIGFFGATPAVKPTGVAVSDAAIHAALVTLGLIAA